MKSYPKIIVFFIAVTLCFIFSPVSALGSTGTGILIPFYIPPGNAWNNLASAKSLHPDIPILAIINLANGSGTSANQFYYTSIKNLQSSGIKVLGYVYTSYGNRNSSSIELEINNYKTWYGVDGIFFDEMTSVSGYEQYYSNLSKYAKSLGLITIGNAGTVPVPTYIGTVDSIVIYDNSKLPNLSYLSGWNTNYDKKNFAVLSYSVDSLNQSIASLIGNYVGYMYFTDKGLPNPWNATSSYLDELLSLPSPVSIDIRSVNMQGNQISNLYTTIQSAGQIIKTGFTPLLQDLYPNISYTISAADYEGFIFDHWDDNSTSRYRTITPQNNTNLTAYYKVHPYVTIISKDLSGNPITGLWCVVKNDSKTVLSGFTPLSYVASNSTVYAITMANFQNYTFDHWGNNSTNQTLLLIPTNITTLDAYYRVG